MLRSILSICSVFLLGLLATGCAPETSLTEEVGPWIVEVAPPGNDFYRPPPPPSEKQRPPEYLLQRVREIAPAHTRVQGWQRKQNGLYLVRAQSRPEEYEFLISAEGRIHRLEYGNDWDSLHEKPDKLMWKGPRKQLALDEFPQKALNTVARVMPDAVPEQVWVSHSDQGPRYGLLAANTVFYARQDGQIQAIGLIENGALNEKPAPKEPAQLLAEAETLLGPYRPRFDIHHQIERLARLQRGPGTPFGFVVIGDSRSNPELWPEMVAHIDQLVPQPDFILNAGDLVNHGYAKEFQQYLVPPLLKTDLPFLAAVGNHDTGANRQAVEYRYLFGDKSLNYFFDHGPVRFVFFDNVTKVKSSKEKLAWLEGVLATTPESLTLVVTAHKPSSTIEKWAYHSWDDANSQRFAALMEKYRVDHVFFGHIHAYSTAEENGVQYTVSGGGGSKLHDRYGPAGNLFHYLVCDVSADGGISQQVVRFKKRP